MSKLQIWFLDVGHGDCTYIVLPNGARMMIDCASGEDHWPSKMLNYYKINKKDNPAPIPNENRNFGLDKLLISHPHGDHLTDIETIHDEVGFCWLLGDYRGFIDKIAIKNIDFRKRNEKAAKKFIEVVKDYKGDYDKERDRTAHADPPCVLAHRRFLNYEEGIDLNELSWLMSFAINGHKVLFTGDMTVAGINKILESGNATKFREFVKGTTILKVSHHGREDGCSQKLFDAFGTEPLLCIISDEVLTEKNEGTSSTQWYYERTSVKKIMINSVLENRRVLTTRKDKDVYLEISEQGELSVNTNVFSDVKDKIVATKSAT